LLIPHESLGTTADSSHCIRLEGHTLLRRWTRCLHIAGGELGIRVVVAELFVGQHIGFIRLEDHLIHPLVCQWEVFVLINGGFLRGEKVFGY